MISLGCNGRACNCSFAVARTDGTHACIPHTGFARLSLARLSLINLFGRKPLFETRQAILLVEKGRRCTAWGAALPLRASSHHVRVNWFRVCFSLVRFYFLSNGSRRFTFARQIYKIQENVTSHTLNIIIELIKVYSNYI